MQKKIQLTADGSHTIAIPEMDVTYHSRHGAIGESMHVFIEAGLKAANSHEEPGTLHIFEMGFGTGLNALLTLQYAVHHKKKIQYSCIELFPLTLEESNSLNLGHQLQLQNDFLKIHQCDWGKEIVLNEYFTFKKLAISLNDYSTLQQFHCIYFDAFSPTVQPELWTATVFSKLYQWLLPGGILVTYCSKSDVRRAMISAGFIVTKVPGPWGKREMVRAEKPMN